MTLRILMLLMILVTVYSFPPPIDTEYEPTSAPSPEDEPPSAPSPEYESPSAPSPEEQPPSASIPVDQPPSAPSPEDEPFPAPSSGDQYPFAPESESALDWLIKMFCAFIKSQPKIPLPDVCFTANTDSDS